MVVSLPLSSVVLDVVGEGRTLHERMLVFVAGEIRVGVLKRLEHAQSRVESLRIVGE